MSYSLGAVKPHVKKAADYFGPKHGIAVVYGWGLRAGKSDHPTGLALDFMTRNRAQGDALAADVIANAAGYGVKYVIWWRRIWQNGQWKDYHGTSNPHIDHVHVSFNATAGTGDTVDNAVPTTPVGNPLVPDAVEGLVAAFKDINSAIAYLTSAGFWRRYATMGVGIVLIIISLVTWSAAKDVAVTAAKKVANNAKS